MGFGIIIKGMVAKDRIRNYCGYGLQKMGFGLNIMGMDCKRWDSELL